MFNRFNASKCKTQCKMGAQRIKLMRNKKQLELRNIRREVAELLRNNKQGNARIRVESVLLINKMLHAYDIIELFLELLAVRAPLVEQSAEKPSDMCEAMSSLVYAAHRVQDFEELAKITRLLGAKYGREFIMESTSDTTCVAQGVNADLRRRVSNCMESFSDTTCIPQEVCMYAALATAGLGVPRSITHLNADLWRCLTVDTPSAREKFETLKDIAEEHDVEWDIEKAEQEMLPAEPPRGPPPPFPGGPPSGGGRGMPVPRGPNPYLPQQPAVPDNAPFLTAPQGPPPGITAGGRGQWQAGGEVPPHAPVPGPQQPQPSGAKSPRGGAPAPAPSGDLDFHKNLRSGPPDFDPNLPGNRASLTGSAKTSPRNQRQQTYADASAAAAAARSYSEQAREAAEAAQRWASGPEASRTVAAGQARANQGAVNSREQSPAPADRHPQARSMSEVQREYDAAPGPPFKPHAEPGPPSAPVAPPATEGNGGPQPLRPVNPGTVGGNGVAGARTADESGLPAPPRGAQDSPKESDAVADLTARLEALKRL